MSYIALSVIAGLCSAIYVNIDQGILRSRFGRRAFNYTIFSYCMGALLTLVAAIVLQLSSVKVPGFNGLIWPPTVIWPYLLGIMVFNGLSGVIYFLVLLHDLGAVYYSALGGFSLVYVLLLSTLSPPVGLGEKLSILQWTLIGLALAGVVFIGSQGGNKQSTGKDKQASRREMMFLIGIVLIGLNLSNALIEVLTKRALALGVIDPLNYRVSYFICAAASISLFTPVVAHWLVKRQQLLYSLGLPVDKVDLPSFWVMKEYATPRTIALNFLLLHGFVFTSFLAYYFAQFGPAAGPLSIISPLRSGASTGISWLVYGIILSTFPSFYGENRKAFGVYLRENWRKLLGMAWVAVILIILSYVSAR